MSDQFPYWMLLKNNIAPLKWWRYKSCVVDRFFEISTWRNEDKKKYKGELKWFNKFVKKILKKNPNIHWDNKIVIECRVERSKEIIFIGCFDETWSIGYKRTGDKWIQPLDIK